MNALNYKIAPKIFRRSADNSHARFQERSHRGKFSKILKKQDPAIKHTVKFENCKHLQNFLDINITNNTINKKYEFKVHQKDAILILHIKQNWCIYPSITKRIFKGSLHRAHTIWSEKYTEEETQFLIEVCQQWTQENISRKFRKAMTVAITPT